VVQHERAERRLGSIAGSAEAGSTLVETVVVAALLALLTAALGASTLARKPYALRAAVGDVGAILTDARSVAQTTGSGATVVIAPATGGGFVASLYPYRPLPSDVNLAAQPVRVARGTANVTPLAIFIDSSGTTSSSASWTPSSGTLEAEPACSGGTNLTFSDGYATETHTVPCAQAELE